MKIPTIVIEAEEAQFLLKNIGQRQVKEQVAYCDLGAKHPVKIKFNLPPDREAAYPAGEYTIAMSSFQVGKYGNLEINPFELKLEEISTPAAVKKVS